jgi:hypothetical protein
MSNVRDSIIATIFKPVPGGYVYRAPSQWVFGPTRTCDHYLVNEAQKAKIAAIVTPRRPILWQAVLWIGFSLMVAVAGVIAWAVTGHDNPTLTDVSIMVALSLVQAFLALQIYRWMLRRRLRPVLAGLPRTDERITKRDVQQALAANAQAISIKQLVLLGATSVMACTALSINFLIWIVKGQSVAFFWLAGAILFGVLAVYNFRRLILKVAHRRNRNRIDFGLN